MTLKAQTRKEKVNKWDCIKISSFWSSKNTVRKMKSQVTVYKKIFVNIYISDKGILSRLHKESYH